MTYNQSVKDFQKTIKHSLIMLQSDPYFKEFLQLMEDGMMTFYRQSAQTGLSKTDQDKLLGAASFADQTLQNARISTKFNNGNGTRNTGLEEEDNEYIDRG